MSGTGDVALIRYFFKRVLLIDLVIFVIVGLVGVIAAWRTAYQFGQGLIYVGMGAIALGTLSVIGNYSSTRSAINSGQVELNSQSSSVRTPSERARDALREVNRTFGCLIQMIAIGVVSITAGALLQSVGR